MELEESLFHQASQISVYFAIQILLQKEMWLFLIALNLFNQEKLLLMQAQFFDLLLISLEISL